MSQPEKSLQHFLQRWSRRKLSSEEHGAAEQDPHAPRTNAGETDAGADAGDEAPAALPFDLASLPLIESINARTDLRPFFAPGVPEDVTRAALRRAWVSDPAIRDFIGIAENQWDFTKPDGVPGFGALEWTSTLRRMAAGILGGEPDDDAPSAEVDGAVEKLVKTAPPDSPAIAARPAAAESLVAESPVTAGSIWATADRGEATPAEASVEGSGQIPRAPRHGGALPR